MRSTHSIFGRYVGAFFDQLPAYAISKNLLSTPARGSDLKVNSLVFGDTYLFGSSTVNSFRANWNRTTDLKKPASFFGASDIGVNIWHDPPDYMTLSVTSGFNIGGGGSSYLHWAWTSGQLSDDLNAIRGNHQLSLGANFVSFQSNSHHKTWSGGIFNVTGSETGTGLADFLAGKLQTFNQGIQYTLWVTNNYVGLYAQDSWKAKPWLTLSYGLRWEPFFPQQFDRLQQANTFQMDAFLKGIKTSQYVNAPAGMFYPGDPLFGSNGTSPISKKWKDFAPRLGIVWDPSHDGQTVVRAGYGIFYEMNTVELNLATPQGFPWGGRVNLVNPAGGFDDPWKFEPGGNPFPFVLSKDVRYADYGTFTSFDRNTRVPYVQQWNFGIQRQIGRDWLVSASYIGNEVVHLYGSRELNPAVYFPGSAVNGVCTAQGYVFQTTGTCSTTANTNQRRVATLVNPIDGKKLGNIAGWDDGGTRSYNGLLVNTEKRLSKGFSVTGNYTWSHCIGNPVNTFLQATQGGGVYLTPTRNGDRGNCTTGGTDIRHLVNTTGIVSMPKFSNALMNAVASNWRVSGIFRASSGEPFTVVSGTDRALTGVDQTTQYADQISPNIYGNKCKDDLRGTSPTCLWLNPTAFANPAVGTLGNLGPGTVRGPGFWTLNAGLSRIFKLNEAQTLEFRAEGNNVLNHASFNVPSGNLTNAQFGRIQSASPGRIMQFGLKYLF